MKTKVEGLILSKHVQGERNLVVKLLLRSGKIISTMFYGGRGGGEKKKASVLELGTMLKLELARSRSSSDMYSAKEWEPMWMAKAMRENHIAFYALCFIVQVAAKVAVEENLHDDSHGFDEHSQGIFRAVSNALVHLENSVEQGQMHASGELVLYLAKMLIELGVFPELRSCMICDAELKGLRALSLSADHGGFVCHTCTSGEVALVDIFNLLGEAATKKSPEITPSHSITKLGLERLWQYFCFQTNLDPKDFKTLSMIP